MTSFISKVFAGRPEADDTDEPNVIALRYALAYGQCEGDHHRAWVIDRMVRALTGDDYEAFLGRWESNGEPKAGLQCHGGWQGWEEGVAP